MKKILLPITLTLALGAAAHNNEVYRTVSESGLQVPVASIVKTTELAGKFDTPVRVVESFVGGALGLSAMYITVGGLEEESQTWQLPVDLTITNSVTIKAHPDDASSDIVTIVGTTANLNDNGEVVTENIILSSTFTQNTSSGLAIIDPILTTTVKRFK